MKIIFVASGNKYGRQVSSFVRSQYESLQKEGLNMLMCPVSGHGWKAYAQTVLKLRQMIRHEQPDIIHAHYTTCGFVASLACIGLCHRPKILVSILGSFPSRNSKWKRVRWAIQHLWDGTLTKSKRTADQLGFELPIVPNGVNINIFHPVSKSEREVLRLRLFGEKENNQSQITNHQSQITSHKPFSVALPYRTEPSPNLHCTLIVLSLYSHFNYSLYCDFVVDCSSEAR